jgi:hypothetical protein
LVFSFLGYKLGELFDIGRLSTSSSSLSTSSSNQQPSSQSMSFVQKVILYFENIWNLLDIIGLLLLLLSVILQSSSSYHAFAALCCAMIPMTITLLQYFFLSESIGKLTLIIFAMTSNLVSFLIVFVIIMIGFILTLSIMFEHTTITAFSQGAFQST